jgi:hypothetical protein
VTGGGSAKAASVSLRAQDKFGLYALTVSFALRNGSGVLSVQLPRAIQNFTNGSLRVTVGSKAFTQTVGISNNLRNRNKSSAALNWTLVRNAFTTAVARASRAAKATKARAIRPNS